MCYFVLFYLFLWNQDVISNGRINTKFLETTTPASIPVLSVPSVSSIPSPNSIDDDFGYSKKKTPSILVHYNAEPIDGSTKNVYIPPVSTPTPTTIAPPISTTYRPIISTASPFVTSYPIISSTTPYSVTPIPTSTPISISSPSPTAIALPSKYFLPPFGDADNSPIIRIKPYNPLRRPVAAYTIEQINNELQPPLFPAVALNDVINHGGRGVPISSTIAPSIYPSTASGLSKAVIPLYGRGGSYYRGVNKRPIAYYQPNQLDLGSDEKYRNFDRYNARIANGFGYYLPRQYHEETYREANPNNRDGSYGYIDPFGIRRVVYYHASPDGGFKTRKNNRYVGFHAKPYDLKKPHLDI